MWDAGTEDDDDDDGRCNLGKSSGRPSTAPGDILSSLFVAGCGGGDGFFLQLCMIGRKCDWIGFPMRYAVREGL